MRAAHFYLKLHPEELLEYYQGHKRFVRVKTYEGYSIQFRAEHLRAWVTSAGIHGEFEIRFDDQNKFAGLVLYRDFTGTYAPMSSKGKTAAATPKTSDGSTTNPPPSPSPKQRPRGFNKSI